MLGGIYMHCTCQTSTQAPANLSVDILGRAGAVTGHGALGEAASGEAQCGPVPCRGGGQRGTCPVCSERLGCRAWCEDARRQDTGPAEETTLAMVASASCFRPAWEALRGQHLGPAGHGPPTWGATQNHSHCLCRAEPRGQEGESCAGQSPWGQEGKSCKQQSHLFVASCSGTVCPLRSGVHGRWNTPQMQDTPENDTETQVRRGKGILRASSGEKNKLEGDTTPSV